MKKTILIISSFLFLGSSCEEHTQPANCDPGFLQCEDNNTECCEVMCNDGYHNCGSMLVECCLDTTSHNFTWEIDTLGLIGSILHDVAIVDENNIWVVGDIRMPDPDSTNGTGYQNYNAAHWDGINWELMVIRNPTPTKGIIYFSNDDIWMVNGYPMHWDGEDWTLYSLHNYGMLVAVEHLWGTSSSNMYFVGRNGAIVHYNGTTFTQMNSGTDVKLLSITGFEDKIWVCGYEDFIGSVLLENDGDGFKIVYFKSHDFDQILSDSLSGKTMAVWTNSPDSVNVNTPFGIYRLPANSSGEARFIPNYWLGFPFSIGGNSQNDIFTGGDFSSVYHYNGSTYQYYPEFSGRTRILSIKMKEDISCLVGVEFETNKAIIIRGYHE
mgnify:CR=1 FL=1